VDSAPSEASLSKTRVSIEQLLAASGKRVVILMGDIDRLDKDEIQAIFRLVKVAADFERTAYVLAFDASVVADALAERYARCLHLFNVPAPLRRPRGPRGETTRRAVRVPVPDSGNVPPRPIVGNGDERLPAPTVGGPGVADTALLPPNLKRCRRAHIAGQSD
jgi:hypothetical protein